MADHKDNMGAVTHQISGADEDVHKSVHVKEANVGSVALGTVYPKSFIRAFLVAHHTDYS
jgi:hypothetical protein